jgi:hypothetical protein
MIMELLGTLQIIPWGVMLNLIFLSIIVIILKFNPAKPSIKDVINWIKLKFYKTPSIARFIDADGNEREFVYKSIGTKIQRSFAGTDRTYIPNPQKTTRRNKVPVYTFLVTDAQGVDFFDRPGSKQLDSEIYDNCLVNAQATANADFFKKLWGYRHFLKFAGIVALCSVITLVLVFNLQNYINTIDLCVQGTLLE